MGNSTQTLFNESSDEISELTWDTGGMFLVGTGGTCGWKRGLQIEYSYATGFPSDVGTLKDKDFDNQPASEKLTRYSEHTLFLERSQYFDVSISWNYPLTLKRLKSTSVVSVAPLLNYNFIALSFRSKDGFLQYGEQISDDVYEEWNSNIEKVFVYGDVIAYTQETSALNCGFSVYIPVQEVYVFTITFMTSVFIQGNNMDTHYLRDMEFHDVFMQGRMFNGSALFTWTPTNKASVFFSINSSFISMIKGESEARDTTNNAVAPTKTSVEVLFNPLSFRLGVKNYF